MAAIFAKIGFRGIDSDLATFFRAIAIVVVLLGALLAVIGEFQALGAIAPRTWSLLAMSGLATGAS